MIDTNIIFIFWKACPSNISYDGHIIVGIGLQCVNAVDYFD